ncbi:Phosphatidate phosphatase APP1 [Paramyrothecium foliicola]|nr:Phosphatidate phosphatase APP1 [Paramyrothecium foliicola]
MKSSNAKQSTYAGEMQLRTRKERKFDEIEAGLPEPRPSPTSLPLSKPGAGGLFNRISSLLPFSRNVSNKDIVWLFDNTAFKSSPRGPWKAEFVAAVFEQDAKCSVVDMVTSIARTIGLADDAAERATIEERLMPFLWDLQSFTKLRVNHLGGEIKLGPTGINGLSNNLLKTRGSESGSIKTVEAIVPSGAQGILDMQMHYAGPEGWGIISDIDDTIKVTLTSDPLGILRETFVNPATPIPGMPELYAEIKSFLPEDTPWFYLSASPYNLYPFLREFRDEYFPPGTLILRDQSWRTIAGLLSALTMGTEEYKADRMKKINSWLPKRKMIVIGDSTQSDPEAYGEIYRAVPGWIKMILIRKATDVAAVGIEEKNEPERFERAFKDIPREAWHVFEDPSECVSIIQDVVSRD